jgi:hypothetical protein
MTTPAETNPPVVNSEKFKFSSKKDFVGIKSYIITFDTDQFKFTFKPISGYSFITPKPYNVIIYKLKMLNKTTSKKNVSIVPYYVSDGSTNGLRANLIFPFVCFNERNISNIICPYNSDPKFPLGLLYKYSVVKNLNLKSPSISSSTGLDSVLPRIQNLLDFIICLVFSNKLDRNLIIHDLLSFRPFLVKRSYNFNLIPIKDDSEIASDKKRKEILEYLIPFKEQIHACGIINVEEVYVILSDISIEDFNKNYGMVCQGNILCNGLKIE